MKNSAAVNNHDYATMKTKWYKQKYLTYTHTQCSNLGAFSISYHANAEEENQYPSHSFQQHWRRRPRKRSVRNLILPKSSFLLVCIPSRFPFFHAQCTHTLESTRQVERKVEKGKKRLERTFRTGGWSKGLERNTHKTHRSGTVSLSISFPRPVAHAELRGSICVWRRRLCGNGSEPVCSAAAENSHFPAYPVNAKPNRWNRLPRSSARRQKEKA